MNTPADLLPDLRGPNAPHWLGARDGSLMVQRCGACGAHRFPAAPLCSRCGAREDQDWVAIRAEGTVASWCRFHRAYFPGLKEQLPYTVLLVELDHGIRLFANWSADCEQATPVIGSAVSVVFERASDDVTLVRFRPSRP